MKRIQSLVVLVLVVCLPPFALHAAQSHTAATSAEESAVRKALSGLGAADKAADIGAVLSHYANDAMLLPPNAPVLSGQTGVRGFYEMMFQLFRIDDISFDADEIHVAGEWAFAQGFINGQLTPKGEGTPRKLHEKFLMVLHREKENWKIYRIIWNTSEPPPSATK